MKIRFVRNTIANGRPVYVGDCVDLPDRQAQGFVYRNQAVPADGDREQYVAPAAITTEAFRPSRAKTPRQDDPSSTKETQP